MPGWTPRPPNSRGEYHVAYPFPCPRASPVIVRLLLPDWKQCVHLRHSPVAGSRRLLGLMSATGHFFERARFCFELGSKLVDQSDYRPTNRRGVSCCRLKVGSRRIGRRSPEPRSPHLQLPAACAPCGANGGNAWSGDYGERQGAKRGTARRDNSGVGWWPTGKEVPSCAQFDTNGQSRSS